MDKYRCIYGYAFMYRCTYVEASIDMHLLINMQMSIKAPFYRCICNIDKWISIVMHLSIDRYTYSWMHTYRWKDRSYII